MNKLNNYTLKSFIGPFLAAFFVALFVLLMQFLWRYIDDLVGKGLPFSVIAQVFMYSGAALIPMALPLATLLASIMTFGNLSEHNEMIAMKSAGISLLTIMKPLIYFAVFTSIGAFLFSNYVLPVTNLKYRTLLYDVRNQPAEVLVPQGVFYNGIEGYSLRVERKDKERKMLYGILIHDHTKGRGNYMVSYADSGNIEFTNKHNYLILTLYSGYSFQDVAENKPRSKKTYPLRRDIFGEKQIVFDLSSYNMKHTDENLFKNHYQMLSVDQLSKSIDSLYGDFSKRRVAYVKNIEGSSYFKRLSIKDDSLFANLVLTANGKNCDSLYAKLNPSHKNTVLKASLNYARGVKTQIMNAKSTLKNKRVWINKHKIAWHEKYTFSLACLILFFIGAPLGAIIRKGGIGFPTIISVLMFVLYYVISITGKKYAKEAYVDPFLSMWMATIIFIPIGVYLTYQASKDRSVFNFDRVISHFQKRFLRFIVYKRYKKIRDAGKVK